MIRFVVDRSSPDEVQVITHFGWQRSPIGDISDSPIPRGFLGFGCDSFASRLHLARLLLDLALARPPLTDLLCARFAENILGEQHGQSFTISSADLAEWALDELAEEISSVHQFNKAANLNRGRL